MESSNTVQIELDNQSLHFSCAHFTVFSAKSRERLHGHNFTVRARAWSSVGNNGLAFDYNELKTALRTICQRLDEYTLIPLYSPYLDIKEQGEYFSVSHNQQTMLLLQSDTLLLPVSNITLEELNGFIIEQLQSRSLFERLSIERFELSVSSGPGQRVKRELRVQP
ncbi:6-pyruvoyl trahydropterin synthase family protein [Oceanicoccus sagamiensis]|uniref:6-carboxy-5,6,7,8-tetrahydropterin synthase n=1 Tax=Oceanicoccus sagamiensis TaxID=716816 RepID=A0A1X9NIC7_9GAMM|nr:6-carboxytetrahydropterin synthase [Oceanicoccus sagamiensis]ARN75259.1 hypothetical protein BST96_14735 [Oceanicoccus sagamiensis]